MVVSLSYCSKRQTKCSFSTCPIALGVSLALQPQLNCFNLLIFNEKNSRQNRKQEEKVGEGE